MPVSRRFALPAAGRAAAAVRRRPHLVLIAGALLLAAAVLTARLAPQVAVKPIKQPNEYFHAQRAWPGHDIPAAAYANALAQARELRSAPARSGGAAWLEAGPTNVGGRITAIAVDPADSDTQWIGAADGGVLRTTDGGSTWLPLLDDFGGLSVGALAHHPTASGTLLCGTGEANASGDSYDGIGLLRTTDGGDTWAVIGLPNSQRIGKIAWDVQDPDRIHVAVSGGLYSTGPDRGMYRSTDGGSTWERTLYISDMTSAIDVAIDPTNGDNVYAAMWERLRGPDHRTVAGPTSGIWRSTDGGTSWSEMTNGVPTGNDVARIGLAVAPSEPSRVYAVYSKYSSTPGVGTYLDAVYRTDNSGSTWSQVSNGSLDNVFSSFGWYFGQIRVQPTNSTRVYVLGVNMMRSTNGGVDWSYPSQPSHVDHHDLWINPADVLHHVSGHDGGLDQSTSNGNSWAKAPDLPITQFYAIAVDPQLPHRIYGGTQDNSTPRTLTGAVDDWDVLYFGDGFTTLVDPTSSSTIYAEYQWGGFGKSTDNGSNWSFPFYGGDDSRVNWHMPYVMDPSDRLTLYAGTYRVHRSTNGGNNWTVISGDLTNGAGTGNLTFGTLTTLAVAPSSPSTIYSGADDGSVNVTTNGGSTWTNIEAGLPTRWITRVAVDPLNRDIAYVSLSGYKEDVFTPHVFRSTNRGGTWTDISGNLPDAPVNDVIVDPLDTDRLYVATDVGVYVTNDLGGSWEELGTGLPLSVVIDLELHNASRTLVAGTHGRSSFTLDLGQAVDSPIVAAAGLGQLALRAPVPNPSADASRFYFSLPRATDARLSVYDVSGRRVRTVRSGPAPAGPTDVSWDGRDDAGQRVASGMYFARLEALGEARTVKVSRIR